MRGQWTFVGLSHRTADIALRGRAALEGDRLARAYTALADLADEVFILSTCNRTEIYVVDASEDIADGILRVWSEVSGLDGDILCRHTRAISGPLALEQLFRVTAGLDAQIVGETEILGQVKAAIANSIALGAGGRHVSMAVQAALAAARRAHRETGLDAHPVSVGSAAVALARQVYGDLSGRKVLVIGAGEVATLCLRHLLDAGEPEVIVANRTRQRAVELAREFSGQAVGWEEIDRQLESADLVLCSTGAPHTVLYRRDLVRSASRRHGRPLMLIDLAVPHDIEADARDVPGLFLYDLDDIGRLVASNQAQRAREAVHAGEIVVHEAKEFERSMREREAVPLIRELRGRADEVRTEELERALRRLGDIGPAERRVVEELASRIVNKLLNDPTLALKEMAAGEDAEAYLSLVRRLFHLGQDRPAQA